jgi:branched-chain amino acid transport system substrate-binding protein
MRNRVLRARALAGAACVALAAVLAGCGTTAATTTTITGTTLTIYSSLPLAGPPAQSSEANDVLDAERLALQQAGSKVGHYAINFVPLNNATGAGWSAKLIAANARTVIQNKNTVAYIGEIDPNASAQSIPITNAAQVLQVSPYDTAIGLTQATNAVAGSPDTYYQSQSTMGRNFGRVVPNDIEQAKAQLQLMQGLGVKKLFIAEDGGAYGDAVALAVDENASTYGITAHVPVSSSEALSQLGSSGADALFYGGTTSPAAVRVFNGAVAADPQLKLFGPGGLYASSFTSQLTPAAQRAAYLSEPGVAASADPAFLSAFEAAYHHVPWTQAIFGYAAMQAVLGALHRSVSAANRSDNLTAFFATKNASSALGTYSIDKSGDTSLAPYIFSRVKGGRLVPFKSVTVP